MIMRSHYLIFKNDCFTSEMRAYWNSAQARF